MSESILRSVAKNIGLPEEYNVFDPDLIMAINTVMSDLNQLGIGPEEGFEITDDVAVWDDLLQGEIRLNSVKSYTYMRVKLMFDPPTTSYLIDSYQKQVDKAEFRINLFREEQAWISSQTSLPQSSG